MDTHAHQQPETAAQRATALETVWRTLWSTNRGIRYQDVHVKLPITLGGQDQWHIMGTAAVHIRSGRRTLPGVHTATHRSYLYVSGGHCCTSGKCRVIQVGGNVMAEQHVRVILLGGRLMLEGRAFLKQHGGLCKGADNGSAIVYGGICYAYPSMSVTQYGGHSYIHTSRVRFKHRGGWYRHFPPLESP